MKIGPAKVKPGLEQVFYKDKLLFFRKIIFEILCMHTKVLDTFVGPGKIILCEGRTR